MNFNGRLNIFLYFFILFTSYAISIKWHNADIFSEDPKSKWYWPILKSFIMTLIIFVTSLYREVPLIAPFLNGYAAGQIISDFLRNPRPLTIKDESSWITRIVKNFVYNKIHVTFFKFVVGPIIVFIGTKFGAPFFIGAGIASLVTFFASSRARTIYDLAINNNNPSIYIKSIHGIKIFNIFISAFFVFIPLSIWALAYSFGNKAGIFPQKDYTFKIFIGYIIAIILN